MAEVHQVVVLQLPRPWPPHADVEILKQPHGNLLVRLFADTQGRFRFEVFVCGNLTTYLFQPVVVVGSGWTAREIKLSADGAGLCLNWQDVLPAENAGGRSFVLKTKEASPAGTGLIFEGVDLNAAKSDAERVFLGFIAEMDSYVQEGSWYSALRAAGLLWRLFLDGHPLVHIVNRAYRQEFKLETLDYTEPPPGSPEFWSIYVDPCLLPDAKTITSDLEHFVNAPCLVTGDVEVRYKSSSVCVLTQKEPGILGR